jgi:hypothetical protein
MIRIRIIDHIRQALYRLMPEFIDFAVSNINSTILYYFIRKKTEIRTHNPKIQF